MADNEPLAGGAGTQPLRSYQFALDIQGLEAACFTACTGIGMSVEALPFQEAVAKAPVRWLAGKVVYSKACLRFGVTTSTTLWEWINRIAAGEADPRNVTIKMYAPDHRTERVRYDLMRAWPCEWAGAQLDSQGRDVAFEHLKLVYEDLKIEPQTQGGA